ncbi:zinc-binding dehydrogenase [Streptomyces sp. NPDC008092]|uniref:zinc-binding dehydrogenase n=1 Tax=Streptomyces sp. NPDC008092 TaxID=3364808 RepID=UPI0036E13E47
MSRRVVYTRGGPPADVLTVVEEPGPAAPQTGQVLVRVTAFPVHPGDLQAVEAYRGSGGQPVPAGVEATGVVEAVGPDTPVAPGVEPGARVTVFPHPGAWSQWIVAASRTVVAVPAGVSDEVAAQMLVNPITAVMLRREAEAAHSSIGYGGVLLQSAAGSSVGRLLTAVSLAHSISLVNVVRSERGAAELRKRFPGVPVVTTEHEGWADDVRAAADGRPVGVALDPIGGKLAESLVDLLTPGGTLVCYGQMAAEPISLPASTLLHKSLTLRGKTVGHWISDTSPDRQASDVAAAKLIAVSAEDQFDVAGSYGLDDLAEAVEHVQRPGKVGTVLIGPW